MNVHELKCARCDAPIELLPGAGSTTHCKYCGATLVLEAAVPLVDHALPADAIDFTKVTSLTLVDKGPNEIGVIKALREALDVSLKDARTMAESAPRVVADRFHFSATMIDSLRRALNAAGATTSVELDD